MDADERALALIRGAIERDMRCAVFDALVSTPKVPYTDEGVGLITRAISDYCNTFRERTGRFRDVGRRALHELRNQPTEE